MKKLFIPALLGTTLLLTACSFTLRGKITDIATGNAVENATVSVDLGEGRDPRTAKTNAEGNYRIKKDDRPQDVTYTADGFESFTVSLNKEKVKNTYLIPSPQETARRIVESLRNEDMDLTYGYLHPNYQSLFTLDRYKELNQDFVAFLKSFGEYRIAEVTSLESYKDDQLNKVYTDVRVVTVVLVNTTDGSRETYWRVYLQLMEDQGGKTFYHWLFNRTTTGAL